MNWQELPALRSHDTGPSWQPGAGGMCLHTILLDPSAPGRMFAAISAAGAFRSDDAGQSWRPINRGLQSEGIPDPDAEVGHCVHRLAMHPDRPHVLFMQKHWDVMRSDDGGESWHEVSGNLPTDFGFPIDVHAHEPDTVYVVPITSDAEHYPPEGKLRVYRSRTGGGDWERAGHVSSVGQRSRGVASWAGRVAGVAVRHGARRRPHGRGARGCPGYRQGYSAFAAELQWPGCRPVAAVGSAGGGGLRRARRPWC